MLQRGTSTTTTTHYHHQEEDKIEEDSTFLSSFAQQTNFLFPELFF